MRYCLLITGMLLGLLLSPVEASDEGSVLSMRLGDEGQSARRRWLSQDLRLTAGELLSEKAGADRHLLVCRDGFEMAVAGQRLAGHSAVVRIEPADPATEGVADARYRVGVYLTGASSPEPGAADRDTPWRVLAAEEDRVAVLTLIVVPAIYGIWRGWRLPEGTKD